MQKGDDSKPVNSDPGIYPEFQEFLCFIMRRIINDHVEKAAAAIASAISEHWSFVYASSARSGTPALAESACLHLRSGVSESVLTLGIRDAAFSAFFKDFKEVMEQQISLSCSIKSMLIKDPLSGLFTNAYFDEVSASLFREGKLSGLAFIDIDKFKLVNEKFGHRFGNGLIASFGSFLKEHLSRDMAAFRYGGDEFAIIYSGSEKDEMTRFLEGFVHVTSKTEFRGGTSPEKVNIAISCGCVFVSASIRSETAMLSAAENAMFSAKNSGGSRLVTA